MIIRISACVAERNCLNGQQRIPTVPIPQYPASGPAKCRRHHCGWNRLNLWPYSGLQLRACDRIISHQKKKIITIIIAAVVGIAMLIAGWHVLSDSGKIAELGWIKTSNNNNGNPDSDSANRDPLTAKVVSECDGVRDAAAADFADDGDHLRVALSMDDSGTMQTVRLLGCIASQAGIGSSDGSSFSQQSFQDGTQLMSELFGLAASDPSKYVYSSDEAKSAVSKMEYQSVDGDLDARCVYDANNSMLYCHMKSSSTDSSEE